MLIDDRIYVYLFKQETHCFPLAPNLNELIGQKYRELLKKPTWQIRFYLIGVKDNSICYRFNFYRPLKKKEGFITYKGLNL